MGIVNRIQIVIIALGLTAAGCAQQSIAPRSDPAAPREVPSAKPTQVAGPRCLPGQIPCQCPTGLICLAHCSSCLAFITPAQNANRISVASIDALALGPVLETCGQAL